MSAATEAGTLRELLQAQLRQLGAQVLSPDLKQVMAELTELATEEGCEAARNTAVAAPAAAKAAAGAKPAAPLRPPPLTEPALMEIQRVGASQTQAARSAMVRPLTLAEAPPGTAKMITLLNLISTAVMSGQKILYAGPDSDSLRMISAQVAAVIGQKLEFVLQIGSARDFDEARDRVLSSMQSFSELEAPSSGDAKGGKDKDGGEGQAREKPTVKTLVECDEIFTSEFKIIDQVRAAFVAELRQPHKQAAQPGAGGPSLLAQKGLKTPLPAAELKKWRDESLGYTSNPPDAARAAEALARLSQSLRVTAERSPSRSADPTPF